MRDGYFAAQHHVIKDTTDNFFLCRCDDSSEPVPSTSSEPHRDDSSEPVPSSSSEAVNNSPPAPTQEDKPARNLPVPAKGWDLITFF